MPIYTKSPGTVGTSPFPGSGPGWSTTPIPDSSGAYLGTGQYTNYLTYTNFGFTIPANEYATDVQWVFQGNTVPTTTETTGDKSILVIGAASGPDYAQGVVWNGTLRIYAPGGLAVPGLTSAQINGSGFGLAISAQQLSGPGSSISQVVRATVSIQVTTRLSTGGGGGGTGDPGGGNVSRMGANMRYLPGDTVRSI